MNAWCNKFLGGGGGGGGELMKPSEADSLDVFQPPSLPGNKKNLVERLRIRELFQCCCYEVHTKLSLCI